MSATDKHYNRIIQKHFEDKIVRWLDGRNGNPISIEIHPAGKVGCLNRCPHCTGALHPGVKSCEEVPGELLIDFIRSLREHGVDRFVISGCRTEPLTYKYIGEVIEAIKDSNLSMGIHTSGELLTPDLVRLIASDTAPSSYIAFSVDSYDSSCYIEGHQPLNNRDPFPKIIRNAFDTGRMRYRFGSALDISWHYLFLKCNVHCEQGILNFVRLAKDSGADRVRFSTPLFPVNNRGQYRGFEIVSEEEVSQAMCFVQKARQEMETPNFHVATIQYESPLKFHEKPSFRYCYHGEMIGVVGSDGYIYPCTAVASVAFSHLRRGHIADFWKVWEGKKKLCVPEDCPGTHCDRFEGAFNRYVERMLSGRRGFSQV